MILNGDIALRPNDSRMAFVIEPPPSSEEIDGEIEHLLSDDPAHREAAVAALSQFERRWAR